jgi:hypothetical protein
MGVLHPSTMYVLNFPFKLRIILFLLTHFSQSTGYFSALPTPPPPPSPPSKTSTRTRFQGWLAFANANTTSTLENEHTQLVFKGGQARSNRPRLFATTTVHHHDHPLNQAHTTHFRGQSLLANTRLIPQPPTLCFFQLFDYLTNI